MKQLFILIALFTSVAPLLAQSPGAILSGTVVDSASGKPLAAVSVYLNNTSKGTVTDANGLFRLAIPAGVYELVISAIGYESTVVEVDGNRPPSPILFRLRQISTELAAVTVEPFEKHGWSRYGEFFRENFIGAGGNAPYCRIVNKEVLRFYFYRRGNRLRVTAAEPLLIENDALGYEITYQLKEFVADFNTKSVVYNGYPFFKEKTPAKNEVEKNWLRKRWSAYRGSMMHFMRSLYAGHLIRESFLIQQDVVVPNWERRRVRDIYRPEYQKAGLFSMDTLHYFWDVLRQPDPIQRRIAVSPDSIVGHRSAQSLSLYFDGTLLVSFGVTGEADSLRQSAMHILGTLPVTVESNGRYYSPREVQVRGYWSASEKISNLLPLDYIAVDPTPRPVLH